MQLVSLRILTQVFTIRVFFAKMSCATQTIFFALLPWIPRMVP